MKAKSQSQVDQKEASHPKREAGSLMAEKEPNVRNQMATGFECDQMGSKQDSFGTTAFQRRQDQHGGPSGSTANVQKRQPGSTLQYDRLHLDCHLWTRGH